MTNLNQTINYYFSVEGETEQRYLKWLQDLINDTPESAFKVSFDCSVQKKLLEHKKLIDVSEKMDIFYILDYESEDDVHVKEIRETMDNTKRTKELGKQINYKFGYTNLTFDLWIILHSTDCNGSLTHRKQYLQYINRSFNEKFESMDDFKHENNFKRVLGKLTLQNVKDAVERAKKIMRRNEDSEYILQEYKGYRYYKENPSLAVWEEIERVLVECGLA